MRKYLNLLIERMAEIVGEGGSSANGRPNSLSDRRSDSEGSEIEPVGRSRSDCTCARSGISGEAERRKGKGSHGSCSVVRLGHCIQRKGRFGLATDHTYGQHLAPFFTVNDHQRLQKLK